MSLQRRRLDPSTNRRYDQALIFLHTFLRTHHQRISYRAFLALPLQRADELLADFVEHAFHEEAGACRQRAINAVYGCVRDRPALRRHIPTTLACLDGWQRQHPSQQYTPIPWDVAVAIAMTLCRWGKARMGLAVLVAFAGLLRGGELLSLLACNVIRPDPRYPDSLPAVVILRAKTGRLQYVELHNREVADLLFAAAPHATTERVFPFSMSTFRSWFYRACVALRLPRRLHIHGLRHGGCTHLRLYMRLSAEELRLIGRWKSFRSMDTYLQQAVVLCLLAHRSFRTSVRFGQACLQRGLASSMRLMARLFRQQRR
jgi:hypothetical protein